MNVLESRLQNDITADDFHPLVQKIDFTSPNDSALLWLPIGGRGSGRRSIKSNNLVTPHDTPGGLLLDGLVFCASGNTNPDSCTQDESNAYWQLWKASYQTFAAQISGKLLIVVDDPYDDVNFLIENALEFLNERNIPNIEVWTPSSTSDSTVFTNSTASTKRTQSHDDTLCSTDAVVKIIDYLINVKGFPKDDVSCNEDLYEMTLCHNGPTSYPCLYYKMGKTARDSSPSSSSSSKQKLPDETGYVDPGDVDNDGHRSIFRRIMVWLVVCTTAYCLCKRIIYNRGNAQIGSSGYGMIGSDKTFDGVDQPARSVASRSTVGSSIGAESFFLNDPEAVRHDAASRLMQ